MRPHRCEECGKCFLQENSLMRHMLSHTGEKKFQCKACTKTFTLQATLYKHMIGHKLYKCSMCQKSFKQRRSLKHHELIHLGTRKHSCMQCKKRFFQKYQLKEHLLTHDKGEISGLEQGKMYSTKKILDDNEPSHNDGNEFKCETCKKVFTCEVSLASHILLHPELDFRAQPHRTEPNILLHDREKYYTCDSCGRAFGRKVAFIHHLDTHKKEKNCLPRLTCNQKNLYKCQECKQVFDEEIDLDVHGCMKKKKKKFVCKTCGITSTKSGLSKHMKSHKKRQCPVCNKTIYNLTKEQPVLCCMKKSVCIKCMKRIYISVNKIGESSSYLCESCIKEINEKCSFNLGHFGSVKEILKILGDSALKAGSPCNKKILKQEGDNMEECTDNDTEFHKSEEDKEILDIGQHFIDYIHNESQMMLPDDYIKEECDS